MHIYTHMYAHIHGCTYTWAHLCSLSLVHVHIHSLNCGERTNRFQKPTWVAIAVTIAVLGDFHRKSAHSSHQHTKPVLCCHSINDVTMLWPISRAGVMLWNVVISSELKLSFMEGGEASEDAETPQTKLQEGCEIYMTWEVLKVKITCPFPNYTSLIMVMSLYSYTEYWGREIFSCGAACWGAESSMDDTFTSCPPCESEISSDPCFWGTHAFVKSPTVLAGSPSCA